MTLSYTKKVLLTVIHFKYLSIADSSYFTLGQIWPVKIDIGERNIFRERKMDGRRGRKVAKKRLGVTVSSAMIDEGTKDASKSLSWLGIGSVQTI